MLTIARSLADTHVDIFDVHIAFGSRYGPAGIDCENCAAQYHFLDSPRLASMAVSVRRLAKYLDPHLIVIPFIDPTVATWIGLMGTRYQRRIVPYLRANPWEGSTPSLKSKAALYLYQTVVHRSIHGTLSLSKSLCNESEARFRPFRKSHWAPNPLMDFPSSTGRKYQGRDRVDFRILYVGRFAPEKDLSTLIRSIAELQSTHSVILDAVGDGPDLPKLRALCEDLGISSSVFFYSWSHDLAAFYEDSDCLVLPSPTEGFGNVLVEALSFGLPIVATSTQHGARDLITGSLVGEFFSPRDHVGLASALRSVSDRANSAASEDVRREVASQYSIGSTIEAQRIALESIIRDIRSHRNR